ncbi:MAG: redoxin domain-containing protein [Lewinellaceae bacterium]|nr:redoxin domain-containing protein [Lewinellaceae bacterium]
MALLLPLFSKTITPMVILKRSALFLLIFGFSSIAFFKADAQTTLTFQPAAPAIDSTQIEAYLEGIPAGMAKLVGVWGDQNFIADSAAVDASGHLVLRRKKLLAPGFYTFLLPGMKQLSFLIDKDQRMTMRAKAADFMGTMQVEGSINTDLFYQTIRFQAKQEPELAQTTGAMNKSAANSAEFIQAKQRQMQILEERKAYLDGIFKQYPDAFFTKFKISGQNPDFKEFKKANGDMDTMRQLMYYRDHFWDGVDFNDNRLLNTPVIANKLKRYIKELTPQHPDSLIKVSDALIRRVINHREYFKYFTNWIALQYENTKTTVMDGEAVYVHIIKNYFTDELAFWDKPENLKGLRKHVWEMEASLLGRKGPDVKARDINGALKSIYEMTAPIVVVFMYSPDCEHCQKEAGEVEAIYRKWKSRGVEIYGIAVSTTDEEWKKFSQEKGFTFTNVFDPTNVAIYAKYFVDITPEIYVLNKDRTIVGKNLHPNQLETIFERELKKAGLGH